MAFLEILLKIFKYILLGVVFSSTVLYKIFKYIWSGIKYVLNLIKTDDSIAQEIRSIKVREKPE